MSGRSGGGRLTRTFQALSEPNFRRYFVAQAVSLVGTWLQFMGQIWLVVQVLAPGDGFALGVTAALQSAPMVLALWGGAVADRYDRRLLLLATSAASGLLALVLGLAVLAGQASLGLVWTCAVLLGTVNALDVPARQAFTSELVDEARRTSAIGLNNAAFLGSRALGVALTPAVVDLAGLSAPFLLNAASFAVAVLAVSRLDPAALRPPPRRAGRASVTEGLAAVRASPGLLAPLGVLALVAVFVLNFNVTLPLLAVDTLGGGLGLASALLAVSSAASVASSLFVAGLPRVGDAQLRVACVLLAVALVALAVSRSPLLCCLLMLPIGAGTSATTTITNTLLQQRSEPAMRGRVMSLFGLIMQGSALVGAPLVGAASDADAWGAPGGLAIGAAAALAGVVLSARLRPGRTLRCCGAYPAGTPGRRPRVSSMSDAEIDRYALPNGLRVVLAPDRSRPVTGVSVHYDVGFRSEPAGRTGFAHLFEHLMFQGSESLAKLAHIRYVEASGGSCNGSTRQDWTEYHQVLPAAALERALFCEADRMRAPRLTEENLRNQIAVVKEEIRLNVLNRPYGGFPWLLLPPVLYRTFPNAHNGYGDFRDLDQATVDDCAAFFDTYYAPANAVLTIAGDVDPGAARELVARHFGDVPARPLPTPVPLSEPWPDQPRLAVHRDPHAPLPAVAVGYRLPDPVADLDGYLAAVVLAELLAGGRTARLRERLVHRDALAVDVQVRCGLLDMLSARDPDTLLVTAKHQTGVDPERLLAGLDDELARLAADGPDAAELAGVAARTAADLFAEQDRPAARTLNYGSAELLLGDAGLADRLPDRIRRVGAEQVAAAAAALRPGSRAVLTLEPGMPAAPAQAEAQVPGPVVTRTPPASGPPPGAHRDAASIGRTAAGPRPVPDLAGPRAAPVPPLADTVLGHGLRVIAVHSPSVPMVELRLRIPFPGTEPAFPATGALLAAALLHGTERRGRTELDAMLAGAGADLAAARDPLWLRMSGQVLAGGLDTLLGVLAEVLTEPGYPPPEVTRERELLVDRLAVRRAEPRAIAREALQRYRYGDHPITAELPEPGAVAAVGRDEVRALHDLAVRPAGAALVLVGDLDPDAAVGQVAAALAGWPPGPGTGELPPVPAVPGKDVQLVHRPGAIQAQIRLSAPAVGRGADRYPALRLANLAFGGYFSSRLMVNLREAKGYTYGARSRIETTPLAASLLLETETANPVTAPALAEIRRELARLGSEPPSGAEVDSARQYAIGALLTSLDTQAELASVIAQLVAEGLAPDWLRDHRERLGSVTADEVAAAAREFFGPAGATGVVVGDADALAEPLLALGGVRIAAPAPADQG